MNEKGTKRREWVKTVAIIFLSVLLVLTFFSSTIMNYSLPEVATQYVEPGTITAKIRGTGMVESNDPYEVTVKETRKVASVAVRQGDTVQQGDVLVYLEDSESDELEAAKRELESAQDAYDLALLSAEVNSKVIQGANSDTSTAAYRQQITNAQKKRDDLQKQYDDITAQINATPANVADISAEQYAYNIAKAAKEQADDALREKEIALDAAKRNQEYYQKKVNDAGEDGVSDKLSKLMADADQAVNKALKAYNAAKTAADEANLAYEKADTALNNKKASGDTTNAVTNLTNQQNQIKVNLDAAQKELDSLLSNISQTLTLKNLYDKVEEAKAKVAKQEEQSIGATVKAEVAGTITTINATAGKEVSAAEPVAIIQPEGKGFTMQFSVTNEQAKRLSVGDTADLINAWRYDDLEVTLASIKPDPQNPGQQKRLTFNISGNATAGQSLNVSVGQKSANYDLIVPNSAIREDNNGKFILIVQTKSTPLNNRYIASRVDVEVLASDDTRSAVNGALYGYEYVITTSTAPVEAGKQVRLADN